MDYTKLWEERDEIKKFPNIKLPCGAEAHDACLLEVECFKELQTYVMVHHPGDNDKCTSKEMVDVILELVMSKKGRDAEMAMRLLISAYLDKLDNHAGKVRQIDSMLNQLGSKAIEKLLEKM